MSYCRIWLVILVISIGKPNSPFSYFLDFALFE